METVVKDKYDPKIILLIIDPQNDFHDPPKDSGPAEGPLTPGRTINPARPKRTMAIPGANEDATFIAQLIRHHIEEISDIFVTMDSHHKIHIAHQISWMKGCGPNRVKRKWIEKGREQYEYYKENDRPEPFTYISHLDIANNEWIPSSHLNKVWCLNYTEKLEMSGHKLRIWPEHCLLGTRGHAVVSEINSALQAWAKATQKQVNYIKKGAVPIVFMFVCL